MKKLFLSSYFNDVAKLLPEYTNNDCSGKNVVFIPTASAPDGFPFYIEADRKALKKLGLNVNDLEISKASKDEITSKIKNADYIFVAGGNTFFLLQEMKRTGVDKLINEHINDEKLYIGSSAGSAILSKNIEYLKFMDDPKIATELRNDFSALSAIDFYIVPHFNNFPFKKVAEKTIKEYSGKIDLRPINNKQVIVFKKNEVRILSI